MVYTENTIKESAEAFVPVATGEYERMMNETITELRARAEVKAVPGRMLWRAFAAAAAVFAALIVTAAAVFSARPALAAEVPVVNDIVYAASPNKTANEADCGRIEEFLTEVFRAFAIGDHEAAESFFKDGAMHTRESYLTAVFTDYSQERYDFLPNNVEACALEVAELSAQQKAFRYTCHATLNFLSRPGDAVWSDECAVRIWENAEGMFIESIEMQSERFAEFERMYVETLGEVPASGYCFDLIPLTYPCLFFDVYDQNSIPRWREDRYARMLSELDGISAPDEEKEPLYRVIEAALERAQAEITPEFVTVEDLAPELMYRYWLARMTGEPSDFEDILEHNEQTDLFLWDAQLKADAVTLGALAPLDTLERGSAVVRQMTENGDGTFTAELIVNTHITIGECGGTSDSITLTLRRDGEGLKVVGFDRDYDDGLYVYMLKPLAKQYKAEGYSWQEAGRMAYEAAYAELEASAGYMSTAFRPLSW